LTPTSTPTASSGVSLLPSSLNFGTVTLDQTSPSSSVTLFNGTSSKLTIKSAATGLDFTIVSTTCSSTLSAGQSCSYTLNFRPLTVGTKSEPFVVNDSSPNSPQQVELIGVGER
jgi:hypothetical protein